MGEVCWLVDWFLWIFVSEVWGCDWTVWLCYCSHRKITCVWIHCYTELNFFTAVNLFYSCVKQTLWFLTRTNCCFKRTQLFWTCNSIFADAKLIHLYEHSLLYNQKKKSCERLLVSLAWRKTGVELSHQWLQLSSTSTSPNPEMVSSQCHVWWTHNSSGSLSQPRWRWGDGSHTSALSAPPPNKLHLCSITDPAHDGRRLSALADERTLNLWGLQCRNNSFLRNSSANQSNELFDFILVPYSTKGSL